MHWCASQGKWELKHKSLPGLQFHMGITEDMLRDCWYLSFPCKCFWQIDATCDDEIDVASSRLKIEACGVHRLSEV